MRNRIRHNRLAIPILIALLPGCITTPTRITPPTPQPVTISILPSLRPLSSTAIACAEKSPNIVLFLDEIPANAMDFRSPGLYLWLGDKPEDAEFAAPVATEEIAAIANPLNPIETIDLEDLKEIFSGQITNWERWGGVDSQVSVWVYSPENEIQQFFTDQLIGSDAISSLAHLAPDPEAMVESIAADPAAIGIIPLSWQTDSVKVLSLAETEVVSTILPVLVLANGEPQGEERALVACLQDH